MREPLRDQLRLIHIVEACDRIKSYFPNEEIPLLDSKSIEFFGNEECPLEAELSNSSKGTVLCH